MKFKLLNEIWDYERRKEFEGTKKLPARFHGDADAAYDEGYNFEDEIGYVFYPSLAFRGKLNKRMFPFVSSQSANSFAESTYDVLKKFLTKYAGYFKEQRVAQNVAEKLQKGEVAGFSSKKCAVCLKVKDDQLLVGYTDDYSMNGGFDKIRIPWNSEVLYELSLGKYGDKDPTKDLEKELLAKGKILDFYLAKYEPKINYSLKQINVILKGAEFDWKKAISDKKYVSLSFKNKMIAVFKFTKEYIMIGYYCKEKFSFLNVDKPSTVKIPMNDENLSAITNGTLKMSDLKL